MLRKMIVLHYRMQLFKMCEKLNLLVALHSVKYSYLWLFFFSSILRNSFNYCTGIKNCSSVIQKWIIPLSFYLTCSSSSCMPQSIGINNLPTVLTLCSKIIWRNDKNNDKTCIFSKSYSPYAFKRRFRPFDQQSR